MVKLVLAISGIIAAALAVLAMIGGCGIVDATIGGCFCAILLMILVPQFVVDLPSQREFSQFNF